MCARALVALTSHTSWLFRLVGIFDFGAAMPEIGCSDEKSTDRHNCGRCAVNHRPASSHDEGGGRCIVGLAAFLSVLLIFITFPLTIWFCFRVVKEYERAILFRLGRARKGAKGPGIFFLIPCLDKITKVDLRTVSFDVPQQEILTKDSVTITVDAVVYYRISDPFVSVVNVEDCKTSTHLLAQTTLRNMLGTKALTDLLAGGAGHINQDMMGIMNAGTKPWGVFVERVEIKDVRLPDHLQRALAAEAEATREAKAKVIAAEGEQEASRSLQAAAEILSRSPAALQLRYLQTLSDIASEKNSTIVFPLPMDLMPKPRIQGPPAR